MGYEMVVVTDKGRALARLLAHALLPNDGRAESETVSVSCEVSWLVITGF